MNRPIDLTGKRIGALVGIRPTKARSYGAIVWLFRCDCGGEERRAASQIANTAATNGHARCGACRRARRNISPKHQRSGTSIQPGDRFGRFTAVRPTTMRDSDGYVVWEVLCDCGATEERGSRALGESRRSGRDSSCEACKPKNPSRLVPWAQPGVCSWCLRDTDGPMPCECRACERRACRNGRDKDGRPLYRTKRAAS